MSKALAGALIIVLVFGMSLTGCATTQHSIEISNVSNIRELNIRNAGTTNWGPNLTPRGAQGAVSIDRSGFSRMVDIRVVDANGFVHTSFNVPFDDAAFGEPTVTRYYGLGSSVALGTAVVVGIGVLVALGVVFGWDEGGE